jgi:hypothetical protein
MCGISQMERLLAALSYFAAALHVDHLRGQQPKAGMMVFRATWHMLVVSGDYILPLTSRRADLQSNGSARLRFDCGLCAFT